MSRKTKKEKILAAYRKKLRLLKQTNTNNKAPLLSSEVKEERSDGETSEVRKTEQPSTPKYFFLDLRKSLILVVIIIALEFLLYSVKLIK